MTIKKLNMNRVKSAATWLVLVVGLGSLLFFSIQRKANADVDALIVKVFGDEDSKLIQEKTIEKMIKASLGFDITKSNIKRINLQEIEEMIEADKRVHTVDVYFDSKNRIHADIVPKKPILRVSDANNNQYYLDEEGVQLPAKIGSAVRVPIATGHLVSYDSSFFKKENNSNLKQVFTIMKYVNEDQFLKALIEQIHVDEHGEIVLIPKIGRGKLIFGGSEGMREKFDNLKIFYRDGLPKLGWSSYTALNLKFTNQVVLVNPQTEVQQELAEQTYTPINQ